MFSSSPQEIALIVTAVAAAAAALSFWIWMLVDCLLHEPAEGSDKIAWTVVIVVLQLLGALLYFFVRRPRRNTHRGTLPGDSPQDAPSVS
jgi:hypothetical protein